MKIALSTCQEKPRGANDDQLLVQSLVALGATIEFPVWTDQSVDWSNYDKVLIRSTWDYHLLGKEKEIVVKPAITATAELSFRVNSEIALVTALKSALSRGEVLLQPFHPSIQKDGELSLIYWKQTEFSHGVLKQAARGDYRVQTDFGGSSIPFPVPVQLQELGRLVLSQIPQPALYARVDIMDWQQSPKIGEIEFDRTRPVFSAFLW